MFGYVKPLPGEMLLKEYELYKAIYCGLCRTGGKTVSRFTRALLSYDFTALAALRLAVSGAEAEVTKKRCPYTLKKKPALECDGVFTYTAAAFACLYFCFAKDRVRDEKALRRFFGRVSLPFFRHMKKRAEALYPGLYEAISAPIEKLWQTEGDGEKHTLDEYAHYSAEAIAAAASFGLEGDAAAIAKEAGYHIGRYIYILDAIDDLREDVKKDRFNPLLSYYGSIEEAERHTEELDETLRASAVRFSAAAGLAEKSIYTDILENIARFGMDSTVGAVYDKYAYRRKENERL